MLNAFNIIPSYSLSEVDTVSQVNNPLKSLQYFQNLGSNLNSLNMGFNRAEQMVKSFEASRKMANKIFLEDIEPRLEKRIKIFFDSGWWLIPSLPYSFFYEVHNLDQELTPTLLTEEIVKYFNDDGCKELDAIVDKWELEFFIENNDIFTDALWAHKKSKYTLTVPALAIQVEGIIRTYLDNITEYNSRPYRDELKKKYEESMSQNNGLRSYMEMKNLEFLEVCLRNYYRSFDPSIPKDFDDLYRNPLFHGQYRNYNSIVISTKLFLFLDMLHDILKDIEEYNKNK